MVSEAINALDLTDLKYNCGQDIAFVRRIVNLFVKQSQSDIQRLRAALECDDIKMWCEAAHSLKGSAGNVGAMELYDIAQDAQQLDRTCKQTMSEIIKKIEEQHNYVLVLLEKEGVYEPIERGEVGSYTGG